MLMAMPIVRAQLSSPAPAPVSSSLQTVPATSAPAPVAPVTAPSTVTSATGDGLLLVQPSTAPGPEGTAATTPGTPPGALAGDPLVESGGVGVREFQGDDVGQVLRLLARQAKINMVVTDQIPPGSTVTMRLEDVTALQAIEIIAESKGLFLKKLNNVYYVKTAAEQDKEPTQSGSYQFSYAQVAKPEALTVKAAAVGGSSSAAGRSSSSGAGEAGQLTSGSTVPNAELLALIKSQLHSGQDPQFDLRTNTVFYRETVSNFDSFHQFLVQIDRPTKQVMIEARLVEVTANPKQAYGINWAGVVGSADSPQKVSYGTNVGGFKLPSSNNNLIGNLGGLAQGTFAILSVPQMSVTLQALNEDGDAEFLANPRIVTADNLPAKIQIVRAQPIATYQPAAVTEGGASLPPTFTGSQDKIFGNTLLVRPSVNKDNFVTLSVKPEISNKVGDEFFPVGDGLSIKSPVIDTRSVESNVLIRSGDTLALGGLMQDEVRKSRTKVPVMGDVPVLGYLFQSRTNERVKRNLLVFVTPTILDPHYGTGLEDQVNGLHHSGEEYADPNGWRNNAKGAVRLVPTANRQNTADYPRPGVPPAPASSRNKVRFVTEAKDRDF